MNDELIPSAVSSVCIDDIMLLIRSLFLPATAIFLLVDIFCWAALRITWYATALPALPVQPKIVIEWARVVVRLHVRNPLFSLCWSRWIQSRSKNSSPLQNISNLTRRWDGKNARTMRWPWAAHHHQPSLPRPFRHRRATHK